MSCERMIGPYKCCSVVQGDCMTLMQEIPMESADLVLTDPPYSETTHEGARTRNAADNSTDNVLVTFSHITDLQACAAFNRFGRVSRRWVISCIDWRHLAELEKSPPERLRFVRFGVWVKPNGAPQFTGDRPAAGWEAIAMLHRANTTMRWNGGGSRAVYEYSAVHGVYPTQKPESLLIELVEQFSDEQGLVLDPFCGSGTTLVAAKKLGRHFLGFDISPEACAIARERIALVEAQPNLFAPQAEQMTLESQ